jgi:anti-sigma factor RsiW
MSRHGPEPTCTARRRHEVMTICTSIDTLATVYLDAELADEELRDFEMHVRECAACRGRVEAERELIATLRRRLATAIAPAGLRARLTRDLDAEDRKQQRVIRCRRIGSWALVTGILGALALSAKAILP